MVICPASRRHGAMLSLPVPVTAKPNVASLMSAVLNAGTVKPQRSPSAPEATDAEPQVKGNAEPVGALSGRDAELPPGRTRASPVSGLPTGLVAHSVTMTPVIVASAGMVKP